MTGKRIYNKAACKRLAAELRAEIDLDPMDALDPWQLAELYGIHVIALSALPVDSAIRHHFTVARPEVFSGALVPYGNGAVIVENDGHPSARRRSTMGHELAHVFGEHKFGTSLVNERGCRLADQTQEDEAAEIAVSCLCRLRPQSCWPDARPQTKRSRSNSVSAWSLRGGGWTRPGLD